MDEVQFCYYPSIWEKFEDSQMDHITLGGYTPRNVRAARTRRHAGTPAADKPGIERHPSGIRISRGCRRLHGPTCFSLLILARTTPS